MKYYPPPPPHGAKKFWIVPSLLPTLCPLPRSDKYLVVVREEREDYLEVVRRGPAKARSCRRLLMPPRAENRALVSALWRRKIRNPYVIFKDWGVPYATAVRYCKLLEAGESLEDRPRSGRPRKKTVQLRQRLAQLKANHPKETAAFFARRLSVGGPRVGVSTVKTALKELGYACASGRGAG